MATRRRRTWIIAGTIALAAVVAIAVGGELIARNQIENRIADVGDALPGVTSTLSGGPALMQLASGRIDVQLTVSDEALSAYANCRTDQELTVRTADGGLIVATERTVRGMTLPVEVFLVPRKDGDSWSLIADSVSAGGISLPAERALKILAGKDGTGSRLATRLLDGIPLPSDERLDITSVSFTDGAALVTALTPLNRTGTTEGGGLASLRSCLETPEG
ncbi:hypothetical protein N1031_06540 [Herbiconiux moechotypicola]|uniref:Uncharacterized protein n=1 Tax=Herbiconiux moechotypicola TaxID=637393 RepID=A0ABN3DFE6_9MICO|nr:hypothetical protein [Herbiconiux moechotypicola]MCS5729415.1 hypothetical protein [Herbiconiux moechotypicola]